MSLVLTNAVGRAMLTAAAQAAAGAAGPLNGCLVGLIGADFDAAPTLTLGDLTESTFGGYARSAAVTWAAAFQSGDLNLPYMQGDLKTFACNAAPEETVYGMMLLNGAGNTLLGVEKFAQPVPIVNGGALTILPQVSNDPTKVLAEDNPITA